jgi:hypothetical protein
MSMTGAFSVGNAHNLRWDLPRLKSVHENGYTEQLDTLTYTFDVQPDSFSDTEVDGHAARQFVWQNPPANTVIHVTEKVRVTVRADLSPFRSSAVYPLKQISGEAASYLTITRLVKLPAGVQPLLDSLKADKRSERSVVASVINWVAAHTTYDGRMQGSHVTPDAGWVPVDPQREKFFVDSHHFAFFSSIDAGRPATGAWSADYYGDASPTGAALPNGDVEIVPGDDISSTVTVHAADSVHATLRGFKHDVQGVLLFSR